MNKQPSAGARRQFLLGAGAASVAAATLVAVREPVPSKVKTSKSGIPAGQGYQLSEHVRNYYRTTAV